MSEKRPKFAVIGMGYIYPRHVQAIQRVGGEVLMTCDVDRSKLTTTTNYRRLPQMDGWGEVTHVVICTPNHLHAEMCRFFLKTGRKILCEKPLTIGTDLWGLEGMYVVQQLRYHPEFHQICKAIRSGKKIHLVSRAYREPSYWNSWKGSESESGGVIYVLGSHMIDLLCVGLGEWGYLVTSNIEDTLRHSSGQLETATKLITFDFTILDNRDTQGRHIEVDGEKFSLSYADNLSSEDLHTQLYEAMLVDNAPTGAEVKRSIFLIDFIKKQARRK